MADGFLTIMAEIGTKNKCIKYSGVSMRMHSAEFNALVVCTTPWDVSTPTHKARGVSLYCTWDVPVIVGTSVKDYPEHAIHYFTAVEYGAHTILRRVDLTRAHLRDPRSSYHRTTETDITLL